MAILESYLSGTWQAGTGPATVLVNPATEAPIAEVHAVTDLGAALAWARDVGGPHLRAASFATRGQWLEAIGRLLHEHREALLVLAIESGGNTRGDAKFDVDGAAAVLASYAALARSLGERPWIAVRDGEDVARGSKIRAHDVLTPRHGVAVQINAFNFPAWGLVGKLAVSLLAGVPVLAKPATSTAALAHRIARLVIEAEILPEGAFQLLLGPAGDLLEHVGPQDVIAFTGSAATARSIRTHPAVVAAGARVNVEADSLNAVVVGPDVDAGSALFDLVVRDVVIETTQKAGQKCTATRRIVVPHARLPALREAVVERLREIAERTGDPRFDDVRMGPLANASQRASVRSGIDALGESLSRILGDPSRRAFAHVPEGTGYFVEPTLFEASPEQALDAEAIVHALEVFGPVATLLPYDGTLARAARIVAAGRGSLVGTLYTDDRTFTLDAVTGLGPHLGRLVLADERTAAASFSPGAVFPNVVHGGPGRAGGGAELGGLHGLELYMQRTTLQGGGGPLARLLAGKTA